MPTLILYVWSLTQAIVLLCCFSSCSALAQTVPKKDATRTDRKAWRSALKIPDECEKSFEASYNDMPNFGGLKFYTLGHQKYLVHITCYSGAYDPGFLIAYYEKAYPTATTLLNLPGYESTDDYDKPLPYSNLSGYDTFNPKTKVLAITSRWRGAGDCGQFIKYRFVGTKPVVIEARAQTCDRRNTYSDSMTWPRRSIQQIGKMRK